MWILLQSYKFLKFIVSKPFHAISTVWRWEPKFECHQNIMQQSVIFSHYLPFSGTSPLIPAGQSQDTLCKCYNTTALCQDSVGSGLVCLHSGELDSTETPDFHKTEVI